MKNFKEWYTKKRNGFVFDFANWVLLHPKAFGLTLKMSFYMTLVIFTFLMIITAMNELYVLTAVFAVFVFVIIKNLRKFHQIKFMFDGLAIGKYVWGETKNEREHEKLEKGDTKTDGSAQETNRRCANDY